MAKEYKVIISGEEFMLTRFEIDNLFKERTAKLIKRAIRKGGEIRVSISNVKEELFQ